MYIHHLFVIFSILKLGYNINSILDNSYNLKYKDNVEDVNNVNNNEIIININNNSKIKKNQINISNNDSININLNAENESNYLNNEIGSYLHFNIQSFFEQHNFQIYL